jgi:hypothetical protein
MIPAVIHINPGQISLTFESYLSIVLSCSLLTSSIVNTSQVEPWGKSDS